MNKRLIFERIKSYGFMGLKSYKNFKENSLDNLDDNTIFELLNDKDKKGYLIDERWIEYLKLFELLSSKKIKGDLLDVGSTINFEYILKRIKKNCTKITINTLFPEKNNFNELQISYLYGDVRNIPFKSNSFDAITCISMLEHLDMDNYSIYNSKGIYKSPDDGIYHKKNSISRLKKINSLIRSFMNLLKNEGCLYITFPVGKPIVTPWMQIFEIEDLNILLDKIIYKEKNIEFFTRKDQKYWYKTNNKKILKNSKYNSAIDFNKDSEKDSYSYWPGAESVCCLHIVK